MKIFIIPRNVVAHLYIKIFLGDLPLPHTFYLTRLIMTFETVGISAILLIYQRSNNWYHYHRDIGNTLPSIFFRKLFSSSELVGYTQHR